MKFVLQYNVKQTRTNPPLHSSYHLIYGHVHVHCAMSKAKKGQQNFPILKKTTGLTLISVACQSTLKAGLVGFLNPTSIGFKNPTSQFPPLVLFFFV